jgi:uncharacterized protein
VRVFLDTNVLVAAFATRGLCADVLRLVLTEHKLVSAEIVIAELETALQEKIELPTPVVGDIVALVRRYHVEPKPKAKLDLPLSDADDLWVLASAVSANAEVFITGDQELLALQSRLPFPIINPRNFWEMQKEQGAK